MATEVCYRGNPALAGALVQMLEAEGLRVDWQRPQEQRGGAVELVVIPLLVAGGYDLVKLAVAKFLERFPNADVDVDDPDA